MHGDPQPGERIGRPIIAGDTAVAGVRAHHVVAIDLATREARWVRRVAAAQPATLTAYPDGSLIVLGDRTFETLDARTGEIVAALDLGPELARAGADGPFSRPGVTHDHVFAGDYLRSVIAVERATGAIVWEQPCKARLPAGNAPLVLGDTLHAVDSKGFWHAWRSDGRPKT